MIVHTKFSGDNFGVRTVVPPSLLLLLSFQQRIKPLKTVGRNKDWRSCPLAERLGGKTPLEIIAGGRDGDKNVSASKNGNKVLKKQQHKLTEPAYLHVHISH